MDDTMMLVIFVAGIMAALMAAGVFKVKIVRRSSTQWRCAKAANTRSKAYKQAYRASKKAMLSEQCEICGLDKNLCWDHKHDTGEFRGTLCSNCNTAIGLLDENLERFYAAIQYLENHNEQSSTL
jgi:hypothetical protein